MNIFGRFWKHVEKGVAPIEATGELTIEATGELTEQGITITGFTVKPIGACCVSDECVSECDAIASECDAMFIGDDCCCDDGCGYPPIVSDSPKQLDKKPERKYVFND